MTEETRDAKPHSKIGPSQDFVISCGFRDVSAEAGPMSPGALIGVDGSIRLFIELTADTDRPEVRPRAAWQELLKSVPPGWTLRVLQAIWPDPAPRNAYRARVEESWHEPANEGLQLLYDSLLLFLDEAPLPYARRTIVELAVPESGLEDAFSFLDGAIGLLGGYGIIAHVLDEDAVQQLARAVFNPPEVTT